MSQRDPSPVTRRIDPHRRRSMMKQLFKNAKIYDGAGDAPFRGEILIDGDRIAEVFNYSRSEGYAGSDADAVYDLEGLSVSPGFIDMHSHNDWFAIKKEPLPYFEPFIRQGITTFIAGNCGLSCTGFDKGTEHVDKMGGNLFGYKEDTVGIYPSAKDLLDAVDGNCPCNMATLVGHGSARASVVGFENRDLTEAETEEMIRILEESLEGGALGVSLGLMYEPGLYSSNEELRKVVELCVKHDKVMTVHPKAESKVSMGYPQLLGRSHLLRALDDLVEISKGTDLKLQYSHAIFIGAKTIKDMPEFLDIVKNVRDAGVRFQWDIYNDTYGVSVITVFMPAWYMGMSEEERNKPVNKFKISVLVNATKMLLGFNFNNVEVAYIGPGYEHYEGKTVAEIARENGKKDLDMYLQLCRESNFQGRVNMGPYTTDEIIHSFEKNPLCLYMTDAWVEEHGVQNPALYDCFPRFLRDSLKGLGDTMPQTIRRMTGASADRFEIKDRGYIRPDYYADLTVFSEDELRDTVPDKKHSFGIRKVMINGKLILDEGTLDEEALKTSGRAIRG